MWENNVLEEKKTDNNTQPHLQETRKKYYIID